MFEYIEDVANGIVEGIKGNMSTIEADVAEYEAQAAENEAQAAKNEAQATENEVQATENEAQAAKNEAQAAENEAQAAAEEATCPHYKEESYTTTDENGNMITEWETVPDTAADAASMAAAAALRAQAATLRAEATALKAVALTLRAEALALRAAATALKVAATTLRALASSLKSTIESLEIQVESFSNAIQETNATIEKTLKELDEGINATVQAIASFNIPDVQEVGNWITQLGDNALKKVGIDFSNEAEIKINSAIGWIREVSNQTGAMLTNEINSLVNNLFLNNSNSIEVLEPKNFEEAKMLAKDKFVEYLNTLNYSDEMRQELINKYNKQIDNIVVLSDEEFYKRTGHGGASETRILIAAINNGPEDKIYVRESFQTDIGTFIHESNHSSGTMVPEGYSYYGYYNEEGEFCKYEGNFEDADVNLIYVSVRDENGTIYPGIDEATTEYVTRKIYGEVRPTCAYNASVDCLESITDSMTKYNICDGEQLLMNTYYGADKDLLKNKINEIVGNDEAYSSCTNMLYEANQGDKFAQIKTELFQTMFELRCAEYSEKNV